MEHAYGATRDKETGQWNMPPPVFRTITEDIYVSGTCTDENSTKPLEVMCVGGTGPEDTHNARWVKKRPGCNGTELPGPMPYRRTEYYQSPHCPQSIMGGEMHVCRSTWNLRQDRFRDPPVFVPVGHPFVWFSFFWGWLALLFAFAAGLLHQYFRGVNDPADTRHLMFARQHREK